MTAAGYAALQNELKQRIETERAQLVERLQAAIADDSNIAENSEYQTVKTEQEQNEARIAELEDKLARAEVIEIAKLSGDTVKFGATVTLLDEDTKHRVKWQLVGEPETDAARGKISINSPIARGLIGKAKGSVVEILTPNGAKAFKIEKVEWLELADPKPTAKSH